MSFFKAIQSFLLSLTLILWQTGQCYDGTSLKDDQTRFALESTSKQLATISSPEELTVLLKQSMSPEDLAWLQSQKEFSDFHQSTKVTMEGDGLVLKTKGKSDVTISVVNKASLTFKVNG